MEEFVLNDYHSTLYQLKILSESYIELTPYQLMYEADQPDVSNAMQKNANIQTQSDNLIIKLIKGVITLIKNIISSITNFFSELFMGSDERKLYEQYQQMIQSNPEFANKKITVKDFRQIIQKEDDMYQQGKAELERAAAENRPPSEQMFNNILDLVKNGIGAGTAIMTTEVAIKAARSNIGTAKLIQKALNDHEDIMVQLEKNLGKKEAKKFKKEIDKDTRLIGFHRALVSLQKKKYDNLKECVTDTFKQLHDISKGKLFGNLGLIRKIVGNDTFKPIAKQAVQSGVKTAVDEKIKNPIRKAVDKVTQKVSGSVVNRGDENIGKSAFNFITGTGGNKKDKK